METALEELRKDDDLPELSELESIYGRLNKLQGGIDAEAEKEEKRPKDRDHHAPGH